MPTLPLLPLGTVLLPGARLPLHVFEPRYLTLLRDLFEAPHQERVFGVVAIRKGFEVGEDAARELYDVGCAARLDEAVPTGGEQRFFVVSTGTRRFHIDALARGAHPYATAQVTWLDDPDAGVTATPRIDELARRVRAEHAAYRVALRARPTVLPQDPTELSYRVTDATALGLADRQRVLQAPDTRSRLALVLQLVQRERELIDQLQAVPEQFSPGGPGLN